MRLAVLDIGSNTAHLSVVDGTADGAFRPLAHAPHLSAHLPASAHSAHAARIAPAPLLVTGSLSSRQWDQLVTHIGKLAVPTIAAKPSGAAVKDPQRP